MCDGRGRRARAARRRRRPSRARSACAGALEHEREETISRCPCSVPPAPAQSPNVRTHDLASHTKDVDNNNKKLLRAPSPTAGALGLAQPSLLRPAPTPHGGGPQLPGKMVESGERGDGGRGIINFRGRTYGTHSSSRLDDPLLNRPVRRPRPQDQDARARELIFMAELLNKLTNWLLGFRFCTSLVNRIKSM